LLADADNAAIVRAVVQMAQSLSLKTVAEGIEDEGLIAHLSAMGCDQGQGYGIARPMHAAAFLQTAMDRPVAHSLNIA